MNGKSHEFFADNAVVTPGTFPVLLSDHFEQRRIAENEALRDSAMPDYFIIPEHLQEVTPQTERVIAVTGNSHLRAPGDASRAFRPNQVRALNAIFEAGRFVTDQEVVAQIGIKESTEKRQLRAVDELYDKVAAGAGKFLLREECDGVVAYAVDPTVAFEDCRDSGQLPEEQRKRQSILSAMCRRFSDDPSVAVDLKDYTIQPLEHIPRHWRPSHVARYQAKYFKAIPPNEQASMVDQIDHVVEAYTTGTATEDEQRQAAILCNKLIYSYLGLGYAIAYSTFSYRSSTRRIKSFVNEMMAYYPRNDMDRPEDDVFSMAALAVVEAVQTYDKRRSSLVHHVITKVEYAIRDGINDDRRHMYGKTHHEMESGVIRTRARRVTISGNCEEQDVDLPEPVMPEIDEKYESLIRSVNTAPFVHAVFRSNHLRPAEKLILSLSQGIYNDEFEGRVLTGANGQMFVYDSSFLHNPVFKEGMADQELSRMFDVSVSQIARLRESALKKVAQIMRTRFLVDYSKDRWKDWVW